MQITTEIFKKMFSNSAKLLIENSTYFCEIDSKFGDGDHGVTMKKIAELMETSIAGFGDKTIGVFLEELGRKILGVNGGSAGPLWGTMIGAMGIPVMDKTTLDAQDIKAMMLSAKEELCDISTARVGDKTMMDTLLPAVDSATHTEGDTFAVLDALIKGALQGSEASCDFISKFGRAKSYKEQTIGTPDAGAVSLSIFFTGWRLP